MSVLDSRRISSAFPVYKLTTRKPIKRVKRCAARKTKEQIQDVPVRTVTTRSDFHIFGDQVHNRSGYNEAQNSVVNVVAALSNNWHYKNYILDYNENAVVSTLILIWARRIIAAGMSHAQISIAHVGTISGWRKKEGGEKRKNENTEKKHRRK